MSENQPITHSFLTPISLQIQALNNVDIVNIIPKEVLAEIKAKDEHPYFQAYSICHEGVSTPKILGDNAKPIHWSRKAIQSIKNVVTKGIKFFKGHNKDNSTEGREALGEIVADKQMEIDGVLHHVVVGYFPDKEGVTDLDICSQEAEWNLFDMAKSFVADTIDKLTGIALGNSDTETQAFKGAKRLAIMQAFADNKENEPGEGPGEGKEEKRMDLNTIPLAELKSVVVQRGLHPSQLFSKDSIQTDREFKDIFDQLDSLKNELSEKSDALKTLEDEKKELNRKVNLSTARTRLDTLMSRTEDPLTEEQKNFIKGSFTDKVEDVTDEGLNAFIDTRLADYKLFARAQNGQVTESVDGETTSSDTGNEQVEKGDLSKASENELLKEDLDTN